MHSLLAAYQSMSALVKGSLHVHAIATVSNVWVDSEVPEYLELTLNIRTETPTVWKIRARYESSQEPSPKVQYAVTEELFYNPGQDWTVTYILVHDLQQAKLPEGSAPPQFHIAGTIDAVASGVATVRYRVFDDYERAGYAQHVKVCVGEELAHQLASRKFIIGRVTICNLDKLTLQQIE